MGSTIEIFEDRMDYHNFDGIALEIENLEGFQHPNPIDLWYDKNYYGRVDQNNNFVYISEQTFQQQEKMKMISERGLYVIDFVAKAFEDFKTKIDRLVAFGGGGNATISGGSVLRDIVPVRAFKQPIEHAYQEYIRNYLKVFGGNYLRSTYRDKKIKNFWDYLKFFMDYMNEDKNRFPITKSGFIGSTFCSPLSTGLIIELSVDNHNDDDKKAVFIEDESFEFYQSLAKQYGFYVDKNAPWRLVANISSPQMQRYWIRGAFDEPVLPDPEAAAAFEESCEDIVNAEGAVAVSAASAPKQVEEKDLVQELLKNLPNQKISYTLNPASVGDFFDQYYEKSYKDDCIWLIEALVFSYNQYIGSFPTIIEEKEYSAFLTAHKNAGSPVSSRRCTSRKVIVRSKIDMETELDDSHLPIMFSLYLAARMKEEKVEMSKARVDRIKLEIWRYYNYIDKKDLDNGETFRYINNVIKGQKTKPGIYLPYDLTVEGKLEAGQFHTLIDTGEQSY